MQKSRKNPKETLTEYSFLRESPKQQNTQKYVQTSLKASTASRTPPSARVGPRTRMTASRASSPSARPETSPSRRTPLPAPAAGALAPPSQTLAALLSAAQVPRRSGSRTCFPRPTSAPPARRAAPPGRAFCRWTRAAGRSAAQGTGRGCPRPRRSAA